MSSPDSTSLVVSVPVEANIVRRSFGLLCIMLYKGGCRIFERDGSNLYGLHATGGPRNRGGGGGSGGPALGPILKSLHRGPKRGGSRSQDPTGSATVVTFCTREKSFVNSLQ